jgi:hypothetical protein
MPLESPPTRAPRSWHIELRYALIVITIYVGILALAGSQTRVPDPAMLGSASVRLQPLTTPLQEATVQRTVYVPVYSSMYLGLNIKQHMVNLSSTVSVRNVSPRDPIVLQFVRYYDSAGIRVRDYIEQPAQLGPLASVEFVVTQADTIGGPGANFLVRWTGAADVDEPLIEAVMVGRSGNAGISFTSAGRNLKNAVMD